MLASLPAPCLPQGVCQLIDAQKAVPAVALEDLLPLLVRVHVVKVLRRVRGADGTVAAEVSFSEADERVTLYDAWKMVVVNLACVSGCRVDTDPFYPPDSTVRDALAHLERLSPEQLETALWDCIFRGDGRELELVYLKDNEVPAAFKVWGSVCRLGVGRGAVSLQVICPNVHVFAGSSCLLPGELAPR